jgi:Fur family transcriptional regulator, peroxide stress response regulator
MKKSLKKDDIMNLLKKHNQQITASRLAICEYTLAPKMHFTADNVKQHLATHSPNISLATIYNTLNMLVEIDQLQEIHPPDSKRIIYDSTQKKHYHVYDPKKKKVYDIDSDKISIDFDQLKDFEISDVSIVLKGVKIS